MLNRQGGPPATASRQAHQEMRGLRADVLDADDAKIRQIVALLDKSAEPGVWQTVLEPLRPRLTSLKPPRPLRFARLLFVPFAGLIVPAPDWRPGQAAIPRSVLQAISLTVQGVLGREMEVIEPMITGHKTDEPEIITRAGRTVWKRAGDILAQAPAPIDWADTGLRLAVYAPLARAIATVLRKAVALRSLERDAELGVLQPNEQAIRDIISTMAGEPAEGCAMVFKLMLGRLPHTVSLLRRFVATTGTPADRAMLQTAMEQGTDALLAGMEDRSDVTGSLRDGVFSAVGGEVQRIATLLRDIDDDPGAARYRSRLSGIRKKLDTVCRARFVDGMAKGLVAPLAAAAAPMDAAGQMHLESCARDLRTIETAGRKLGSPAAYDALLAEASEAVREAAGRGNLGGVRAVRLVEILAGPDAAAAMYRQIAPAASRVG
jgi:hypothetical protein